MRGKPLRVLSSYFPSPAAIKREPQSQVSSNQNHWSSPGKKPLAPEPWDPLLRLGVLAGIEQALTPSYSDPSPAHIGLIRGPDTAHSRIVAKPTIPDNSSRRFPVNWQPHWWRALAITPWQALASDNTDIVSDKHIVVSLLALALIMYGPPVGPTS